MKLVIKEEINLIGEVRTSSYTVLTNPVTEYNNIPMGIGQAKGDLIVFKAAGNPVRFPAGNQNGKVLMTDSTTPTGWTLGDGGGGGASAMLFNDTGAQLLAGTVCYAVESDGKLKAYKADSTTDQRLYILEENIDDGEEGKAAFVPGSVASVLCDTYEVIYGDPMRVSGTAGLACATDGNATVGYALTEKDPGATGLVKVRLIENRTIKVVNKSGSSNTIGTVYTLPGGDTDGVPNAVLAAKGKRPFGIQTGAQSANDGPALLMFRPGDEAVVRADDTEIRVGDWLVPSASNPGKVRNGNGYGIGEALEAKAANAVKTLVKIKMYPLQYGYSPRAWWLPSGITEDQVLAAYQFVGRASEVEALINVNNGTEYALTKSLDTIVWNSETGFYLPATINANIKNADFFNTMNASTMCMAFGYSGLLRPDSGNWNSGGLGFAQYGKLLGLSSMWNSRTNTMSMGDSSGVKLAGYRTPTHGVLGGNFSSSYEMYHNGESVALSGATAQANNTRLHNMIAQIGYSDAGAITPWWITTAVFYSTTLTAEQHLELANNIRALGGIDE